MQLDPTIYIIAAAFLGSALGFFASALITSGSILHAQRDFWRRGYEACNRDHSRRRPSL